MSAGNDLPAGHVSGQEAETKFRHARSLFAAGKLEAARTVNDAILAECPTHSGALIQRSRMESADDNYRLARDYAKSAYQAGISEKWQCIALLRRLRTFNFIPELRDVILKLQPDFAADAEIAKLVARLLGSINDPESALEFLEKAVVSNPHSADLQAAMGLALLNCGRLDEAETRLRQCLRLEPGHAPAWWQLSRLPRQGPDSHFVDELRREIERAVEPRSTALLAYALHRELDGLGDYPEAASALEQAGSSMRKTVSHSVEEDERIFSALKSLPAGNAGVLRDMPFTPVFIVGMHRSGTTLLEDLLARHHDICRGGELYDFTSQLRLAADHHCATELDLEIIDAAGSFDYGSIGQGYLDSVDWRRSGQRFVTDKLPSNFLNIGFILRALPNARILHMSRDHMETCFSNLREPFSENTCRYSYDQTELAKYYRQYFSLMQHWRRQFPGRIHDVTYTALVTDPAAEMKRVASYLGIDFQASMLEAGSGARGANTASAVQVRQKPSLPLRPKWYPYREYLTPLEWRLSDVGQRY